MFNYKGILEAATGEIGEVEKPVNDTKYGRWFGLNNKSWCGIFVSWCYDRAGENIGIVDFYKGFASCQFAYEFFKKKNKITKTPTPGDIVLFDFDGNGRFEHCGIYTNSINNDYFETIEGNTSTKDNRNGGCVMARKRKYSQAIFIHI